MIRLARYAQRITYLLLGLAMLVAVGGATLATEGLSAMAATTSAAAAAFPGAEGYGALTPGGRGGKVMEVTNLNDSGSGSLRAAVEASGPRIVVFRVGGTIELQSKLKIENPYITIAGQTAPGGGITLKSSPNYTGYTLRIDTHDVVIRYVRIRTGPTASLASSRDGVTVQDSGTYNCVFDHVSLSWGVDENMEFYNSPHDVTFQNSIVSEGLRNSSHTEGAHSMGMLVTNYSKNISVHTNLFAHNNHRNPRFAYGVTGEVVNNLVYNYGDVGTSLFNDNVASQVNVIGNLYLQGPNSSTKVREIVFDSPAAGSKVYLRDNYGPNRQLDTDPEMALVNGSTSFVVTSPAVPPSGITEYTLRETTLAGFRSAILAEVGNSRGLAADGSWYARRDAVDKRLVAEVTAAGTFAGTAGKIIDCPGPATLDNCASKAYPSTEDYTRWGITDPVGPNGWPILEAGVPYADSDHDGMPDLWEARYGFDANNPADGSGDADGDGYTNVEEFLNGTNPRGEGSPMPTPTATSASTATPTATAMKTSTAAPMATPTATATKTSTPEPTATATQTAAPTPLPTLTPTPTATPTTRSTMHVGDLNGTSANVNSKFWRATVTITVHDSNHNPVDGATVRGAWNDGAPRTASCTTDNNGRCSVTSGNVKVASASVAFSVTGVDKANWTYEPGTNHDPDGGSEDTIIHSVGDSDGTTLYVYR